MYRFVLAAILSLSVVHAFSQNKVREYRLNEPDFQLSASLYGSITPLDKRDIQDNLGIVQVGAFNARAQVIAEPSLETQLQNLLIHAIVGDRGRVNCYCGWISSV